MLILTIFQNSSLELRKLFLHMFGTWVFMPSYYTVWFSCHKSSSLFLMSDKPQMYQHDFISLSVNLLFSFRVINYILTLSIPNSIWYCGTIALRGSVSIRTSSSVFKEWNGTRTGNLPTNSCNNPHGTIKILCHTLSFNSTLWHKRNLEQGQLHPTSIQC
jgi:hypothetical protein